MASPIVHYGIAALTVLAATTLNATPAAAQGLPSFGSLFSRPDGALGAKPGTPEWWRANKNKAVFVPGEGFRVEGVDGLFDQNGRPIDAPVDEIAVQLTREKEEEGLLPSLDPKKAANRVREAVGYGPSQQQARQQLAEGVELAKQGKYGRAAKRFDSAATSWPGSDIAALALFNQAECELFDKQFADASETYIKLLTDHPSTPKLDQSIERLWEIAQYWEKTHFKSPSRMPFGYNPIEKTRPTFDTIGNAIKLYDAIRLNDPTGPRADDAIMATAGIHFARKRYSDADYHYTLLRQEYPRSEWQFEAHLLGLQAKMERYHGPDYDGTPLKEAKKLEERIRLTFAGRLSEDERTRLDETRGQLAAMIEQRDLRLAAYYEGNNHNLAARTVLADVLEKYPDTPAAEKAKERLAKLEGEPDTPDVPLEWFVELFPQNQERSAIDNVTPLNPDADVTRIAEAPEDGETTTR